MEKKPIKVQVAFQGGGAKFIRCSQQLTLSEKQKTME